MKYSSNLPEIVQKQNSLIDLIKRLKDTNKFSHLLAQEIANIINKGVIIDSKRRPTQKAMLADENLLVDIWEQLKPALSCIIDLFYMLLEN